MKVPMFFCVIVFFISILIPGSLTAQSQRSVVLSPRVGVVIDSSAISTYRLFPGLTNVYSATFYQAANNSFWALVMSTTAEGILRDSVFATTFEALSMYADRIDHWEELQQGTYRMGTSPPGIFYEDGTPVHPPPQASAETAIDYSQFPFAKEGALALLPTYPDFGFGGGITTYSCDFSDLERAYGAVENYYRKQGFTIHSPDRDFTVRYGWLMSMEFRFVPAISLLVDVGQSAGSLIKEFKVFTASVLYHVNTDALSPFQPFLSAGIRHYHFETQLLYNDRISPVDAQNGFQVLDALNSTGSGYGFPIAVGVEVGHMKRACWRVSAAYVFAKKLSASAGPVESASVSLGGMTFGTQLLLYP
jgi:hypothetical protein